ncbi:MAG: peptide chain release factor N(5)-glutamine methyltransferase [Bacteroidetes bacterium]|nr:peptide chain release factor N(5)-glutamine methyltransferase [Bacteroidota bacterium]
MDAQKYSCLQAVRTDFNEQLVHLYDSREIKNLFHLAVEHATGFNAAEIVIHLNDDLDAEISDQLYSLLTDLKTGKPIQYILGKAWFMEAEFFVNDSVLIPRPETEELIHWVLDDNPQTSGNFRVLDIGTGSGIIPVSLQIHRPFWEIFACDISEDAIRVARTNASLIQTSRKPDFYLEDIFNPVHLFEKPFDIIISNPPYIPKSELSVMNKTVTDFEPEIALFVPNQDPLLFYRVISIYAKNNLSKKGVLYFEIHEDYASQVAELLNPDFADIKIRQDLQGKNRMVKASLR